MPRYRVRRAGGGLSTSGSAALSLAAPHRGRFEFAGSFSGVLDLSRPGVREAMRPAMLPDRTPYGGVLSAHFRPRG